MRKGRVLAVIMAATMLISTLSSSSVYMAAPSDTVSTEKNTIEQTSTDDGKISDYRQHLNYRDNSNMNFDFSFDDETESDFSRNWGVLPESYSSSAYVDWEFEKVNDYITPVKDQNPYGTCWAHSTIAAAESTYIINEGITDVESVDFNEYHLVHYTYDTPADLLGLFGGDANLLLSGDTFLDAGGNNEVTAGVLANWVGVSDSTEFGVDDVEGNNSDAIAFEDAAHLENAYFIAMPDMTSDDYETDMNVVKSMLMKYGAMAVSYCSTTSGGDEFDGYYYCPNEYATNHAVTLVGWDDTIPAESFKTTAPGDGAWLIKNSWSEYGDFGGYFWLSYYDNTIADEAYVYDMVSADNYDNNYQYDGANGTSYSGYYDSSVFANAFVADSAETLEAVGFYTYDVNMDYEVRVYKNLEANEAPQYGDLVLTQTGSETYAGFHTVELNSVVGITQGERYAVVVTISKPGSACYVGLDQTIDYGWLGFESYAKAGESYMGYSINSLVDLNADNAQYADGANVRLKAYTNEGASTAIASGTCGDNLTWTLDDNYTLTISGTGDMWNFYAGDPGTKTLPWKNYIDDIKKVVFQDGVTSVGSAALWGSLSVEKVVFADTITTIGNFAFADCVKLQNFTLPENLRSLGQECFADCDSITELIIPDKISFYGGNLAEWCDKLEYVYIGGSTELESGTYAASLFRGCPSLEAIEVSEENFMMKSVDGVLYTKEGNVLMQYPGGKPGTSFEIPSTVERINNYAFQSAIYLESVVIPESVKRIDSQAFSYCAKLRSITFPASVEIFEDDILNQTLNIQTINNLSTVAFVLPPLESGVWKDASGNNITSIACDVAYRIEDDSEEGTEIGQCGDTAYWTLDENMVLTIYGTGDMWSFYSGDVGYRDRPWDAYRREIKKVVFGEGITSVGSAAFDSHYALETVEFANSITKIDAFAFMYCQKLKNFELPDSLRSLGQQCFANCDSITQFVVPDDIHYYGAGFASSCDKLESVYIGGHNEAASVIYAVGGLFRDCKSLYQIEVSDKNLVFQSINGVLYSKDGTQILQYPTGRTYTTYEIEDTVKEIAQSSFSGAAYLEQVVIPEGVKEIKSAAFGWCSALKSITIPTTVTSIKSDALISSINILYVNNKSNAELVLPAWTGGSWYDIEGNAITRITNGVAVTNFDDFVTETGITLNQTSATLTSGETLQLSASITPNDATITDVTYTSSDESLATVDQNGLVKVNTNGKAGTVVITATTATTKKTATCTVVVEPVKVNEIELVYAEPEVIHIGDTMQITAMVNPMNATNKSVTWTSSNTSVATVDANGKVTAVGIGTAIIKATAVDGSGVSASCSITVSPIKVSKITLNKSLLELLKGNVATLTATVSPSDATNKGVTWTSSNTSVATVDANGKVTAVGVGTATITATAKDGSGVSASCSVTVTEIKVATITLNKSSLELVNGNTATLTATVSPSNAANKGVTWTSSNTSVATVDVNGKVTAVGVGTATITATAKDGSGVRASCSVTVTPIKVASITLNKTTLQLVNGNTATLTATVSPSNAANKGVTWTSSNTSVATVDANGKVTAVGVGAATITATAKDGSGVSASCSVTVTPIKVASITLNKTTLQLVNGNTATLTATVSPSNAANKGVTWTSSNTSVATVDANGKVTAVGVGTATITATAKDGSGVSASCSVTVTPIKVASITLNKTTLQLVNGNTATLTATVSPSNAANKGVTWTSSNTSVATVDANGKVTAVGVGTATITVTAKDGSGVSASCSVTVTPIKVAGITLNKTSISLFEGETFALTATVNPSNAANKGVTWTSSNTSVATVDANGKVTAEGVGTATITVTAKDGSGKKATCTVTVNKKYPNGLNEYTDGKLYYFKDNKIDTTYNGLADYKGNTWYVKNGAVDTSVNGLKQVGSDWYLFANGKVNRTTTLASYGGSWWYVENGQIDFSYDGVADYNNATWYIENGKVDFGKNGLLQRGDWYYFKGGQVDRGFSGLTQYGGSWWYVEKGELNFDYTNLVQYSGSWWYVQNSTITFKYDGVVDYNGSTWYIEDSKVDFGKNGLLQRGDWYYFKGGAVDRKFTGLTNSAYGWWYIEKGVLEFDYTNLVQYGGSWWYVQNSNITFKYDGVVDYNGSTWYIEDSKVDFGKNGLLQRGDWYYFKGGAVDRKFTGLTNSPYGWWYIENGVLEFDFTDLVNYGGSWWYVQNSNITFKYDGVVDYNGSTWYIEDSKVDFSKSGLHQRGGTWYLFKGGAVNRIDSVEYYGGSWWYVDDGVIDFGYNGLGSNASGTWYIKNGKVDFGYNGTYEFEGETYKVVNGQATLAS